MAEFTTKSMTQHGSPYTPPGQRTKNRGDRFGRGVLSTISSNVVLTTLGTIYPDHMDMDLERDVVEMEDIRFGLGMDLGSLSTAIGGDDGEPLPEGEHHSHRYGESPAPPYNTLEIGFRGGRKTPSLDDHHSCRSVVNGIRVDVELSTATI
jgi:hypothetical protein